MDVIHLLPGELPITYSFETDTHLSTTGSAGSLNIDASKGDIFSYNINRNLYFTVSNSVERQIIYLIVQNGSNSSTFTISFDNLHPPASGTIWITDKVDRSNSLNSTINIMQLKVFLLIVLGNSIIVRVL